MTAKSKDEAHRTALAADDLMVAACMSKDSSGGSRVGAAPRIKDMKLEKVKHSGKSLEQRTKAEGLLTDIKDCLDTATQRVETVKGKSESLDEALNELVQDLTESHNEARVHLEASQSRLKELENLFRSATAENFNELQADLGNQQKEMTKGAYKSFRAKASKLSQTITKLERGMKVQNEGRKEGEDVVRAPAGHSFVRHHAEHRQREGRGGESRRFVVRGQGWHEGCAGAAEAWPRSCHGVAEERLHQVRFEAVGHRHCDQFQVGCVVDARDPEEEEGGEDPHQGVRARFVL